MKKILYTVLALSATIVMQSCDPMKDIYADIEANSVDPTGVRELELKLTSAEYALLKGIPGTGNIVRNNAFNSEDSAKTFIPEILAKKYLYLGDKAAVNVIYEIGDLNTDVTAPYLYTVTDSVYEVVTGDTRFKNFNSEVQLIKGINAMHTVANQADLVRITYKWNAGGATNEKTTDAVYLNGAWSLAYTLEAADYTYMNQSFPNFSTVETAAASLPTFLKNKFPYKATEGMMQTVIYDHSRSVGGSRITTKELLIFQFTNGAWVVNRGTVEAALKFSNVKGSWVPDNTIKYTLTTDDHKVTIGELVIDAEQSASIIKYGNFDLKLFNHPDVVKYIGLFANSKFPEAAIGQRYLLTYRTHNPSGSAELWIEKGEDGNYTEIKE